MEPLLPYHPAPPSYEQALQHHYPYMEHPPPPPYPAYSVLKSDPSLYCPPHTEHPFCPPAAPHREHATPDPDSFIEDCGPDTPDSSVKEEPSEASEVTSAPSLSLSSSS